MEADLLGCSGLENWNWIGSWTREEDGEGGAGRAAEGKGEINAPCNSSWVVHHDPFGCAKRYTDSGARDAPVQRFACRTLPVPGGNDGHMQQCVIGNYGETEAGFGLGS